MLDKNEIHLLDKLPILAKYKLLLLDLGVRSDSDFLCDLKQKNSYKIKFIEKNPQVKDFEFYDYSKCDAIIPSEVLLSYGGKKTLTKMCHNTKSFLKITEFNGEIRIFNDSLGEYLPIKVELIKKNPYHNLLTSFKKPMDEYVQIVGLDRISIVLFDGCIHWNNCVPCRFCDAVPRRKHEKIYRPNLNNLRKYKFNLKDRRDSEKIEYLKGLKESFQKILELDDIGPHKHLHIMSGNLNSDFIWNIVLPDVVNVINGIKPIKSFDSYLNIIVPQTNYKKKIRSAKKMGFKHICFNLEVIGERCYKNTCPGKSSISNYGYVINTLKESVKVFGFGFVRSNFVLGIQPIKTLLKGIRELAKNGIVSDYSIFMPKKGTDRQDKKRPLIKDIIIFNNQLIDIYNKYKFRPIYCGLSSRSNITHETFNQ